MESSKGFIGIVIAVVVAIVIGATAMYGYQKLTTKTSPLPQPKDQSVNLIEPSPTDETANWKTFQNNAVKFSLKLPQGMETVGIGIGPPEAKDASEVVICKNCDSTVNLSNSPAIHIKTADRKHTVYQDTPFQNLVKQNYEANIANQNNTKSVVKELEQINFAGKKAFTYTLDSSGYSGKYRGFTTFSSINKIIEVENNGILFVLIYPQDQTFGQILSTFRFFD